MSLGFTMCRINLPDGVSMQIANDCLPGEEATNMIIPKLIYEQVANLKLKSSSVHTLAGIHRLY